MKKINVYYGPKKGFQSVLPKRTKKTTLTQLAMRDDAKRKEFVFRAEGQERVVIDNVSLEKIKCLVAFSEEYSGISEHAIQSFIGFFSQYDIDQLYLHNPPLYIVEQLEKIKKKINILNYKYEHVNTGILRKINDEYSSNIIGQNRVKDYLLSALYPLTKPNFNKPVVLLFFGPTGVGKTETAKFLSKVLVENLFRKQFSMFHSDDFASYLFGGKHSQNCFARELLERESNILLLDEFDKPHPTFHSAFYQLFDEGIFEDKNYSVVVNKSIIICTSNYTSEEDIKSKLGEPIFSRFDAVIKFEPLSKDAKRKIIDIHYTLQYDALADDEKKLIDNVNLKSNILPIIDTLKDVRQIKRMIQDAISTILVRELIKSKA